MRRNMWNNRAPVAILDEEMRTVFMTEQVEILLEENVNPGEVFDRVSGYILSMQEGYFGNLMKYNVIKETGHAETAWRLGDYW